MRASLKDSDLDKCEELMEAMAEVEELDVDLAAPLGHTYNDDGLFL